MVAMRGTMVDRGGKSVVRPKVARRIMVARGGTMVPRTMVDRGVTMVDREGQW